MIRRPQPAPLSGGIELTPLMDIVFIVIVFLLLTANVQVLSLPVDIPETDSPLSKASPIQRPLTVTIHAASPHWVINTDETGPQPYKEWHAFRDALIGQLDTPNTHVLIAPDAQASAEKLLQLLALLNERAFSDVQILMEPSESAS